MFNLPKGGKGGRWREKERGREVGGGALPVLSETHFEVNTLRSLKACLFNMHCYCGG